jgi:hypothetical protein
VTRRIAATLVAAAALTGMARADLQQAKAEPNLEKRSKLALDNAQRALTQAREAYAKGDDAQLQARATEIKESVELAQTSLRDTGKNARKSPHWFKHAEIATRDLLRQLQAFQEAMGFADRPVLDPVKTKVQQVHDDLLQEIMDGRRK